MPLPAPPPDGSSPLPAETFADQVVTGGGTGLGKAIASEFARLGARVAIASRAEDHRSAGVAAVAAAGGAGLGVACDIRDPAQVASAFDTIEDELRHAEDLRTPAHRVGHPGELGWAAVFLCSPWASYVSGHTLVVDDANWQRRHLLMPEFTPIREQLGRGPFSP